MAAPAVPVQGRLMQIVADTAAILARIDVGLFHLFNGWGRGWLLDWLATFADRDTLIKGAVIMGAYWWMWFVPGSRQSTREKVIFALFGAVISLIVSRALAAEMPFRVRPLYRTDIGYVGPSLPSFIQPASLEDWSSFFRATTPPCSSLSRLAYGAARVQWGRPPSYSSPSGCAWLGSTWEFTFHPTWWPERQSASLAG